MCVCAEEWWRGLACIRQAGGGTHASRQGGVGGGRSHAGPPAGTSRAATRPCYPRQGQGCSRPSPHASTWVKRVSGVTLKSVRGCVREGACQRTRCAALASAPLTPTFKAPPRPPHHCSLALSGCTSSSSALRASTPSRLEKTGGAAARGMREAWGRCQGLAALGAGASLPPQPPPCWQPSARLPTPACSPEPTVGGARGEPGLGEGECVPASSRMEERRRYSRTW